MERLGKLLRQRRAQIQKLLPQVEAAEEAA